MNPIVKPFVPQLIYVEPAARDYPLGKKLINKFEKMDIEIRETTSHNHIRNLPGDNHFQKYRIAKSTLVIGLRKTLKFDTSKPSAENAIPFYVYTNDEQADIQHTLGSYIEQYFPEAKLEYFT